VRTPRVLLIGQWIEAIFRGLLFARGLAKLEFDVEVLTSCPN
jgi:hypothetical protein